MPRKPKHEPEVQKKVAKVPKGGRPCEFREEFIEQARVLCSQGATFYDLAQAFNVNRITIWRWRNTVPEFCDALKEVRAEADDRVVNALYERAVGYTHEIEKAFLHEGKVVTGKVKEAVLPDVTAAIFWLKNRRRGEWTDTKQIEIDVNVEERRRRHIEIINGWEAEAQERREKEEGA
jgi:hypothetical protein